MKPAATDGRVARAEAKRQARQAEIVQAAGRVFSRNGYHTSSIADVIAAAGISRGTFYLYFDSKEQLFLGLIDDFVRRMVEVVQVVDVRGPAPLSAICDNLRRVVDVVFDNRELTLLVFRQSMGVNSEIDEKLTRFYGFLREMIQGALSKGAAAGLIRDVNRRLVTIALIGGIKELLYSYLIEAQDEEVDREEITRQLFDFALGGLSHTASRPLEPSTRS